MVRPPTLQIQGQSTPKYRIVMTYTVIKLMKYSNITINKAVNNATFNHSK